MQFNTVLVEREDKIAIVTINRPEKLNALNKETIGELHACFKALSNDSTVRVILLTGSGPKSFVAGADISEFAHFNQEEGQNLAAQGQEILFSYVEGLTKPVIACVNGFALGGGLELAMSCHMRIASENAKLGLPEVSLGVIPGYGGTQRLTALVGKGKALELICSANMLTAQEAMQWGLVNHCVAPEELLETGKKLALKIASNSSHAIAQAIKAVNIGTDNTKGLEAEVKLFGECFAHADFTEGTTAFLNKRKPNFT
ncbi:MAG: enoyl-CoA hydratase/isomerase family protein [Luteibaculaceae bacterium]